MAGKVVEAYLALFYTTRLILTLHNIDNVMINQYY